MLYWEPAKWVARLRRLRTDRNLIAFRTNLDAGHGGAAGRFDRLKEVALAYAFAIKVAARDAMIRAFEVIAQLGDRAEPHHALRKLRLDRTVGVERVGHSVDHARLEHRDRSRRLADGRRHFR